MVLDILSTHTPAALYQALPAAQARRILSRLGFHYTPKHASWLNMAEIEIGVLRGQCLDRRIESRDRFVAELQRENTNATKAVLATTGSSRPSNSPKPTRSRPTKSYNLCAEVPGRP